MDDGLDYQPDADEIWPPAPTLPPLRPQSFLLRHPVLDCILRSAVSGVFGYGMSCLVSAAFNARHRIDFSAAFVVSGIIFVMQLVVQFWILPERLMREREKAALVLETAAAEQSANEEAGQEARE